MKSTKLTLSLMATYAILYTPALAENDATELELDPIVVSDFRAKSLSETSNTVSVIGSDKLYDKSSQNFENVIGEVPNVNFTSGASRAHHIQIRGIGERSQFQTPINPSIGIMVDGMDMSQSALGLTMFDVAQIEVNRGPQGTTYGANGLGGVVNVQSNEPTKETQIHLEGTAGNYNTQALGAALGGTLIEDKLIGRFSIYKNSSDGFTNNVHLNRDDTQNIDELTTKAQLRWFATENHTIDLNLMHLDIDNGYDGFTFDNSRNSHADQPGTDAQKTDAFAIKATSIINPAMHLESRLSYSKSDLEYSYDEDWSYVGEFTDDLWPYSSFDQYLRDRKQVDMDVRLVSDEAGRLFNDMSDWTIGVYAKDFDEDLRRNYTYLDNPFTSRYQTQNEAIYGQLDNHLSDKLTLVTGIRAEKWKAKYSDSDSFTIDTDETLYGGKAGLNYQQNDNALFYTTFSRGYKPGGVNADNTLSANARSYETEVLWNLDLGVNSNHFDDLIKSRLNFFYGKRQDQQVKSSIVQVRDDGSTDFTDYLANAAKTHYYGIESEINYFPSDNLRLFTNVGLLKAEFDEYNDPNPNSVDVNGRTPAQSPKYQYNVGGDIMLTDSLTFKTNLEGQGEHYFSNRHNAKADAYALLHSSLEYTFNNFTATLWGRNLTDEDYQVRGFGDFGNNPGKGYIVETYTQPGNPRTFGITIGYDY